MTAEATPLGIDLRCVPLEDILPLREAVLIQGTGRDPVFAGDNEASTRHIGAFAGTLCVGCLTAILKPWEGEPAWQVRGMAVAEGWRGRGVGASMLDYAERALIAGASVTPRRALLLWCNARLPAVGFYERQGWQAMSPPFEIAFVGPHVRLLKRIEP